VNETIARHLEDFVEIAKVWGPFLVFFFMAVESSFIPFPSEVVMIPAGFMAARGELFPGAPLEAAAFAVVCGVAGSLLGAYVNYWIGLKLGRPLLYRYSRWFFLTPEKLGRAEEIFREYGEVTTFVCRLLPAIRQIISIPAGLSRMDFKRFSFFTGLGAGIWVIVLTAVGFHFGNVARELTYAQLLEKGKETLSDNLLWIILGCAAVFVGYVYVHRRVMHGRKTPVSPPAVDEEPVSEEPASRVTGCSASGTTASRAPGPGTD
jgi:membrane protein DedA with SNARE-associated domain